MVLKPCPFCGGELEESPYSYFINHKNGCFFGTKRYRLWSVRKYNGRGKKSTYDIRKWNSRAERTCRIITTRTDSDYVDDWCYRCSECLCNIPVDERIRATGEIISAANYCPNCGAMVVS